VQSKDVPSIVKLVPAGESTADNAGSLIPDRPRRGANPNAAFSPARLGRTVYEQSCQSCHGPDLSGDRGPRIDNAVATLGESAVRRTVLQGKGAMPAIPTMNTDLMDPLIAFLSNPEAAPPGSAAPLGALAQRMEPDYPAGVEAPPSRYKTGYGN